MICGLLGSYAGAEGTTKNWRRIGIPLFLTSIACITLWHLAPLSLLLLYIPFMMGYGVPCWNDKGSLVGRFWYNLLKKRHTYWEKTLQEKASILTRGTIGKLIGLTAISIPIIKGNWLTYVFCNMGIVLVYAGLSWKGLGSFKFLGKDLIISEFVTYLAVGSGILITIFF